MNHYEVTMHIESELNLSDFMELLETHKPEGKYYTVKQVNEVPL